MIKAGTSGLSRGDKLKIGWAVMAVVITSLDTISDWWAFQFYIRLSDTWSVNYTYLAVCVLSSALFCFEVRNAIVAYRIYCEQDRTGMWDKWEANLQTHQEVVSFLVLILEDIPAVIVLHITFSRGNCALYMTLFRQTFAANLALLGSVISAVFKVVWSLRLCFCRCCHCEGIDGCIKKTCWCCCRIIRPSLAVTLMVFTCYLYNEFNNGYEPRPDCLLAWNTTGAFVDDITTTESYIDGTTTVS